MPPPFDPVPEHANARTAPRPRAPPLGPRPAPPAGPAGQRRLLADREPPVEPYTQAYCEADGSLIWRHDSAHSLDDFYQAFCNWPLLHLIGGPDELLPR